MKFSLLSKTLCYGLILLSTSCFSQHEGKSARTSTISPELVTPEPIENAKRLYNFLKDTYRRKILSGVMTLGSMDEVNWLKTNTGKEPAIVGLDFMHCGRGYTWYNDEEPVNDARNYYNRNGIPVFVWHWRDPLKTTEEFYSDKTTFDVSKINDPASAEYQAMINDIDYVSGLLKILNDEGIPVIWRPLHEAAGGWFWWGKQGAAPCKKLFQVMYDRMVNHHGLKNLIWVWTREPNDDNWYPGDEYVDIVGRDMYKTGDHSSRVSEFNSIRELYNDTKMITLSECGSMPDVDNLVADKAGWLWFMPWYGDYTRKAEQNPLSLWKKMFAHQYVITLDEMPDLKTYEPIVMGIEESRDKQLHIYPTIVTENRVTIEGKGGIGNFAIYNNLGEVVTRLSSKNSSETFSLGLTPGLYFVKHEKNAKAAKILVR